MCLLGEGDRDRDRASPSSAASQTRPPRCPSAGCGVCCENKDIGLEDIRAGSVHHTVFKGGNPAPLIHKIRTGLLSQGVDVMPWPGGLVSAVHSSADIEQTAAAFKAMLAAEI